jgi:Family of unknown function (DUF6515)
MHLRRSTITMVVAMAALAVAGAADLRARAQPVHEHIDHRHGHERAYVDRGVVVAAVPHDAVVVRDGANRYWFHGGIWYRPEGGHYVVIAPPVGVFVPVLPPFYTTLMLGGVPFYYANDAYYVWREPEHQYEVVDPPQNVESATVTPAPAQNAFVYPKKGQTAEQQAKDRYECHLWAVGQTGFDPTTATGDADSASTKRADYQRATSACLEARDYTVR